MKRLLPLIAFLACQQVFAITANQSQTSETSSIGSTTLAFTGMNAVHSGDVIIVTVSGWTNMAGSVFPLTVSDNENGAGYTAINPVNASMYDMFGASYFITATVTGTPTITVSTSLAGGWGAMILTILDVSGWIGTPTIDSGASVQNYNAGGATPQTLTISAAHNNEILMVAPWNNVFINAVPSGWMQFGMGTDNNYYAVLATAGANNFSGTLSCSPSPSGWLSVGAGLYDAPSGGKVASQMFLTRVH